MKSFPESTASEQAKRSRRRGLTPLEEYCEESSEVLLKENVGNSCTRKRCGITGNGNSMNV
jgi:hypothetical protein